ncbi:O-antigen ligase family protein [uncultured Aliiroseovarius sp.]|uniref:O-antigen ligase family protein n=1 Tax=uncultured Aliiroseovarius sp. TaxID=1658783 RepID=UPI002635ED02|nr:O-antigen ligase family protein [uncultured Aliiroseovarius sp.]
MKQNPHRHHHHHHHHHRTPDLRHRSARFDPFGLAAAGLRTPEGLLVAAAVVLAPMNHIRLSGVYITASDIVALAAFILMLAKGSVPIRFFGPATAFWGLSFIAFAGGMTMSSVINGDPAALPNTLAQYSYSLLVLPMILGGRSYAQTLALIKLLIAAYVFVMLFGAYVVHFVDNPNRMLVSGNGRMRSLIQRENETAVHGAIAIVLVLGLYKLGAMRARSVLLCIPPLIYGIMLTGSVSGLLATFLGVTLLVLIVGPIRHIPISAAIVAVVVVILLAFGDIFLPEIFRNRVLDPLLNRGLVGAGTFSDRALLIQEAMAIMKDTVFLGLGVEQFREYSAHNAAVHNNYLAAFVEGGLISLLGLIGFFLSALTLVWAAIVSRVNRQVWAMTLVVLLIYAVAFNMFPTFYARFWNVPWILLLSLTASLLTPLRHKDQPILPHPSPTLKRRARS